MVEFPSRTDSTIGPHYPVLLACSCSCPSTSSTSPRKTNSQGVHHSLECFFSSIGLRLSPYRIPCTSCLAWSLRCTSSRFVASADVVLPSTIPSSGITTTFCITYMSKCVRGVHLIDGVGSSRLVLVKNNTRQVEDVDVTFSSPSD